MIIKELEDKKILILGFGREGLDTFIFLRKIFPDKILGIGDRQEIKSLKPESLGLIKKDGKTELHFGKDYLSAIKDYDIVIKSPGIPIHLPEIEKALKEGKITSQTEIFFNNYKGKIVGVTGTKGKSTTASLIYKILKEGGLRAHLVGNIGNPVLQLLSRTSLKDVYVYELSCHQLYDLKKSPDIAVFLNIYPEHLDYYKNLKEYVSAKTNITRYQKKGDYLIFNPENKIVGNIAKTSRAVKIPINIKKVKNIIKTKEIPLRGSFNLLNVAAAVEAAKIFKINKEKIRKAIKSFKPLPHRLEFVGELRGIRFFNDSLSTIPETAIFALDAMGNNVQTIMLGGYDRNIDFKNLAQRILKSRVKNVILFPTTGEKIWREIVRKAKLLNKKLPRPFPVNSMEEAVKISFLKTEKGKICLLSTASTSFSIFKDYKEKGDLFKKYVKKYGKAGPA